MSGDTAVLDEPDCAGCDDIGFEACGVCKFCSTAYVCLGVCGTCA